MRLYWETVKENYTNEFLIHTSFNPIREFEEEFIEGPILEIGCGQSPLLLEYCQTGREIFAVDNEDYQLKELKSRINDLEPISKVNFINATFPNDKLPKNNYSLIILSNFLHFFSMQDCSKIISSLFALSVKGTLFYAVCHSNKHPHNNPENPKNNDYFKHYFSEKDMNTLFDEENFERIFLPTYKKLILNLRPL